ncbi:hypothetical protein, partial [Streptomyces murinus]
MNTRFRYRAVVPACSLCVAGLLAFTPALAGAAPAAARPVLLKERAERPGQTVAQRLLLRTGPVPLRER